MSKSNVGAVWLVILVRGIRKRCPQCGVGRLFCRWYTLHERCDHCRLPLNQRDGDTWAFMYITTAGITGVFLVLMLFVFRPESFWIGQAILLPAAIIAIGGTLPRRKGMAVAFDFLTELWWNPDTECKFLPSGTPPGAMPPGGKR